MTSQEFKAAYRSIRQTYPGYRSNKARSVLGVFVGGKPGGLYFTRFNQRHGHLTAAAAHAQVLGHAAVSRSCPSDHAHFLAKAKALRIRGTWFA